MEYATVNGTHICEWGLLLNKDACLYILWDLEPVNGTSHLWMCLHACEYDLNLLTGLHPLNMTFMCEQYLDVLTGPRHVNKTSSTCKCVFHALTGPPHVNGPFTCERFLHMWTGPPCVNRSSTCKQVLHVWTWSPSLKPSFPCGPEFYVWTVLHMTQWFYLTSFTSSNMWHSQSKNGLIFPNFVYIFPNIMKRYLSLPKCKGTGSFPKSEVKTMHVNRTSCVNMTYMYEQDIPMWTEPAHMNVSSTWEQNLHNYVNRICMCEPDLHKRMGPRCEILPGIFLTSTSLRCELDT